MPYLPISFSMVEKLRKKKKKFPVYFYFSIQFFFVSVSLFYAQCLILVGYCAVRYVILLRSDHLCHSIQTEQITHVISVCWWRCYHLGCFFFIFLFSFSNKNTVEPTLVYIVRGIISYYICIHIKWITNENGKKNIPKIYLFEFKHVFSYTEKLKRWKREKSVILFFHL